MRVLTNAGSCGAEAALAGMDDFSRLEMGRKTLEFVRYLRNCPEIWAEIKKEEIKNESN